MKKILIINGEPFQDITATGITLKNIFHEIPKERLSSIHISKLKPDLKYLDDVFSYYKDSIETEIDFPKSAFINKSKQTLRFPEIVKSELRIWDDLRVIKFSEKIIDYIVKSKAEVIYTCLGNLRVISLVLFAQKLLGCTIVPHFLDDWKTVIFSKKRLIIHQKLLNFQIKKVIALCKTGMAISEKMATEYAEEYSIPFYSIMNCVPDNQITPYKDINKEFKRFVYAGGLHLKRWKSLLLLSRSFQRLERQSLFKLEIYCPENDKIKFHKYFSEFPFVHFMGHIPTEMIKSTLLEADVLIHCESFENSIKKYTRLSVSTKIPSYLMVSKLLLVFGPPEIESIQYIKRNNAGLPISTTNTNDISIILDAILLNKIDFEIMIKNGLDLVKRNHSFSSVNEKLINIFN
ncbi:MAG: hypothetical protein ABIN01_11105 [Ferruginibacter sp.]